MARSELPEKKMGRLTVLWEVERPSNMKSGRFVECQCDCGIRKIYNLYNIINGKTQSCGCFQKEMVSERSIKLIDGVNSKDHELYGVYHAMKARCENVKDKRYHRYGGRGIKVCERWRNSFELFVEDMGPRPDGYSIERSNNDGNYDPENCKWATMKEQGKNNSRNRYFEINGQIKTLSEWCAVYKIDHAVVIYRIKNGWDVEQAFTRDRQ